MKGNPMTRKEITSRKDMDDVFIQLIQNRDKIPFQISPDPNSKFIDIVLEVTPAEYLVCLDMYNLMGENAVWIRYGEYRVFPKISQKPWRIPLDPSEMMTFDTKHGFRKLFSKS
jgi:hypothetical protein